MGNLGDLLFVFVLLVWLSVLVICFAVPIIVGVCWVRDRLDEKRWCDQVEADEAWCCRGGVEPFNPWPRGGQ